MSITIVGLDKLVADLTGLGTDGARMADAVISANVDLMVVEAKQSAPADLGAIRQQIGKDRITDGNVVGYSFFSNAPESAFQEFGTGGRVDVPSEMSDIASQFKGANGGSMADFILALTGWVKRHGLTGVYSVKTHKRNARLSNTDDDEKAAWAIAKTILRDGLRPQPFFYPAFVNGRAKLAPMLETAFNELVNKV